MNVSRFYLIEYFTHSLVCFESAHGQHSQRHPVASGPPPAFALMLLLAISFEPFKELNFSHFLSLASFRLIGQVFPATSLFHFYIILLGHFEYHFQLS